MPDAIENARYKDTTFGDECVVERVEENENGQIIVHLEYEELDMTGMVGLEQFEDASGFVLLEIPPGDD